MTRALERKLDEVISSKMDTTYSATWGHVFKSANHTLTKMSMKPNRVPKKSHSKQTLERYFSTKYTVD